MVKAPPASGAVFNSARAKRPATANSTRNSALFINFHVKLTPISIAVLSKWVASERELLLIRITG